MTEDNDPTRFMEDDDEPKGWWYGLFALVLGTLFWVGVLIYGLYKLYKLAGWKI